jgi:hypothetical protein
MKTGNASFAESLVAETGTSSPRACAWNAELSCLSKPTDAEQQQAPTGKWYVLQALSPTALLQSANYLFRPRRARGGD